MYFNLCNYTTDKLLSNIKMSFIEQMRSLAIQQVDVVVSEDANVLAEKTNKREQRMKEVKEEKFKLLNEKYFDMIERKIKTCQQREGGKHILILIGVTLRQTVMDLEIQSSFSVFGLMKLQTLTAFICRRMKMATQNA